MLEGGNPIARHHGKGLERATFCHGVELSYCLVTVGALTETTGIPSSKSKHRRTSALLHNSRNIRICMGKNLSFPRLTKMKGFQ